jgi:hypothetical protein
VGDAGYLEARPVTVASLPAIPGDAELGGDQIGEDTLVHLRNGHE